MHENIGWTAVLSNNETFDGGHISSWRALKNKCDKENLKIKSLLFEGQEVDPHPQAVSYFIMYDQTTTLLSKQSRTRICFGSFRKNGKARLRWRIVQSTFKNDSGNYTEIITPNNVSWKDLAIEIERN